MLVFIYICLHAKVGLMAVCQMERYFYTNGRTGLEYWKPFSSPMYSVSVEDSTCLRRNPHFVVLVRLPKSSCLVIKKEKKKKVDQQGNGISHRFCPLSLTSSALPPKSST